VAKETPNAQRSGRDSLELPDDDLDSEAWRNARAQVADLKAVVGNQEFTNLHAEELASRWRVSVRTVWRRVQAFRLDAGVRAFLQRPRGSVPGVGRLNETVESIIVGTARTWWKVTESATIAEIYPDVLRECSARGLARPSRATVARRLSVLRTDPANFSSQVAAKLRDRTRLVKASYTIDSALAVVQVDHTIADVFVVDPVSRKCIGRPTLTVAIDVATRCVTGICLSLEAPSSLQLALCLENAVSPKQDWLNSQGFSVEWPVFGLPTAFHVDNGREFHAAAFRRGCDLNGIDTIYRPPATPRFGGHVERLIGTLMRRVRLLPGNTYSDFLRARPDRAEYRAALTLKDLGGFLVEDINRYHRRTHRSLGRTPLSAWERYWAKQNVGPKLPKDLKRFRFDFLPLQRRVVGREGIELFGLRYSCEALAPDVDAGRRRVVRYDPRDLSHIYLEQPRSPPLRIPLRDPSTPAISLWELRAIKKLRPRSSGVDDPDVLRRALTSLSEEGGHSSILKRDRRKARRDAWRAVSLLQESSAPMTSLQATLVSTDVESLPWEILE
jgi:putative transposase